MIQKRAELTLNNALSLIIAVGGIALLIYAGVLLSSLYLTDENKNAQATLDYLEGKIKALEDGQKGEFLIQGFKTEGKWYLVGFSKDENRPDKCFLNSCLCICKGSGDKESCQINGFCREVDKENVLASSIISELVYGDYSAGTGAAPGKKLENRPVNYIEISNVLTYVGIEKKENSLLIEALEKKEYNN